MSFIPVSVLVTGVLASLLTSRLRISSSKSSLFYVTSKKALKALALQVTLESPFVISKNAKWTHDELLLCVHVILSSSAALSTHRRKLKSFIKSFVLLKLTSAASIPQVLSVTFYVFFGCNACWQDTITMEFSIDEKRLFTSVLFFSFIYSGNLLLNQWGVHMYLYEWPHVKWTGFLHVLLE